MPAMSAPRLQALFASALELPDQERDALLLRECGDDLDALSQIRELLAVDLALANKTLRPLAPSLQRMVAASAPADAMIGSRIGAFELRSELGHGGMGSVYLAERVDGNLEQQVAIKFVRRELLDANTLRRFQLERQTLASLEHPNIARLYDAAELEDGTPYFVMELVDGVPVTEHCDTAKLDVRARVALFRIVCAAVMHAHRNLVVHRDLKPGNILVSHEGAPKLLDFGIAKPLTSGTDPEGAEQTGTAHRYFSPQYSAPEQLLGESIGVGCDVYALGLLLYELLAQTRPFDFSNLSSGQIERLVTLIPPDAPSVAAQRSGAPAHLQRQLRGDLDGIVLRCLRKAPTERYASVEQLDAELGNYLEGRPVQARGGHAWYRVQKFVGRNAALVATAALVVLAMTIGIVAFAWQAGIAKRRAAELELVSHFQAEMLAQVDPFEAGRLLTKGIKAKLERVLAQDKLSEADRESQLSIFMSHWQRLNATDAARDLIDDTVLKPAVVAIDEQFAAQPVVAAALRQSLADLYREMGLFEKATSLQDQALRTRQQLLGPEHADTLTSMASNGSLLVLQNKFDAAEPFWQDVLVIRTRILGESHPDTLKAMNNMGYLRNNQRRLPEAEHYYRLALEGRQRVLGPRHRDTLTSHNNMGALLLAKSEFSEAENHYRLGLEGRRITLGEDHVETLSSVNNMGYLYQTKGRLTEAEPFLREALEGRRRVLGDQHPETLQSIGNVAEVLRVQGKISEAEPLVREALAKGRILWGDEHMSTITATASLALLLRDQGKLEEAEPFLRDALSKSGRVLGEQHPETLGYLSNLGLLLQLQGKLPDAEPILQDVLTRRIAVLKSNDIAIFRSANNLASLYVLQNHHAEAITLLLPYEARARALATQGQTEALCRFLTVSGRARIGLAEFLRAESTLIEAHEVCTHGASSILKERRDATKALVELYEAWQSANPDQGHAQTANRWKETLTELNK